MGCVPRDGIAFWPTSSGAVGASRALTITASAPRSRVLERLSRHGTAPGGLPKATLKRVLEYIAAHLGNEIRLETLASIAGMSQHHFGELFRRSTGVSPYQYVVGQRVEPLVAFVLN